MIFVSGPSRSGTTLLQGMICNSPQTIGVTAECSYFRALVEAYKLAKTKAYWNHAKDYFGDCGNFKSFHYYNVLLPYLHNVDDWSDFEDYKKIVQKEPRLLKVWPELYDFFPEAKYVIIYRDPRDITASQLKRNPNTDINQWLNEQLGMLKYAMSGPQDNIWVRYEHLVRFPETTLEWLGEQLGIKIPLGEWEVKREDDSCSPLDGKLPETSSIGKWKEVIDQKTADDLQSKLGDWLYSITGKEWFDGG